MLKVAILGYGGRGRNYANIIRFSFGGKAKLAYVIDTNKEKLAIAKQENKLNDDQIFSDYDEFLSQRNPVDMLMICTQDSDHYTHAIAGLEAGYNLLLEKPISGNVNECIAIEQKSKELSLNVAVCHVLRYTYFYSKIKEIIESKVLGDIIAIEMQENVGYWHYAHSYNRGDWRNSDLSTPMIFAKCCHDLDIAVFLADSMCNEISSYGKLHHFKKECSPKISADKCVNCQNTECPYDARKLYLDRFKKIPKVAQKHAWPMSRLVSDALPTYEKLERALQDGQFGNCVYHNDNNVVDYQVTQMLFDNGINCTLTMTAFSHDPYRTITIRGTLGELEGKFEDRKLKMHIYGKRAKTVRTSLSLGGHGGGDTGLVMSLINGNTKTDITKSIESHIMAYAAEKSRNNGNKVIKVHDFAKR